MSRNSIFHIPSPKTTACLVGGITFAVAATLAGVILHGKARAHAFSKLATPAFPIPGLDEGFVPQDLALIKNSNPDPSTIPSKSTSSTKRRSTLPFHTDFAGKLEQDKNATWLLSGYSATGDPSPLYVCHPNQDPRRLYVKLCDGSLYRGHGAAITVWGNNVYLTVDDGYIVLDQRDILKAADKSEVYALHHVHLPLKPAFMIAQAGKLYVGEYYSPLMYETPESHHLTAPDGTHNPALMFEFAADPHTLSGFSSVATCAYSIPKEIQGMCCTAQGHMVLSQSFGVGDSHILVFDAAHTTSSDTFAYTSSCHIPLYYFDSGNLITSIPAIPMTEGLVLEDNTIFILDESASKRYLLGRFFKGDQVWALHVPLPKEAC